jgi:hypothetical protein
MREVEAQESGRKIRVNRGDMTAWPPSKRIGQTHAAYKVIIDAQSHQILGTHLLGHNAEEAVNIFAGDGSLNPSPPLSWFFFYPRHFTASNLYDPGLATIIVIECFCQCGTGSRPECKRLFFVRLSTVINKKNFADTFLDDFTSTPTCQAESNTV